MLWRRVIVAIIGIPVIIAILYLGKVPFSLLVALIIALSLVEFYRMIALLDIKANVPLGLFFGAMMPIVALFYGLSGMVIWLTAAIFIDLLNSFASGAKIDRLAATFLGIIYIGLFLSYMVLIYKLPSGKLFIVFTLLGTWITDTSAYGVGKLFGRRPLTVKISPNKTVEGTAGAFIINLAIFALLKWVPFFNLWQRLLFALTISIFSILGDLVESAFKREANVKDSGTLIPGHGGFLDRFDSLIFTGVASYYFIKLFGG